MPRKSPLEIPDSNLNDDPEFPFVQVARPDVGTIWDVIRRVGQSIIGGDFSGNARGAGAIDVQVERANPEDVASGDTSVIFGTHCRASATRSMAFGAYAATDLPDTCNLSGLIVLKANYGNPLAYLCERGAAEIVIATNVVDFTVEANYTLTLPSTPGHTCAFFVSECMVIISKMPAQVIYTPSVQFGNSTDPGGLVPPSPCPHINGRHRYERFAITWSDGLTDLVAGVTDAAGVLEGQELKGRFLFKGILVEDEQDAA